MSVHPVSSLIHYQIMRLTLFMMYHIILLRYLGLPANDQT